MRAGAQAPSGAVRVLQVMLLLLACFLVGLRFFHLTADAPPGLTWSGELYTDEGWYANAALRQILAGHWYLAGDFNPAVMMPLGQVFEWLFFRALAPDLESARLLAALCASTAILASGLVARRVAGTTTGLLAALIFASSYLGFAYSRLAYMEPMAMAFIAVAILVAMPSPGRRSGLRIGIAATLVAVACLVKGTMIFAIPVLVGLAWLNGDNLRNRVRLSACAAFVPGLVLVGWRAFAQRHYGPDYDYFVALNFTARRVDGLAGWIRNFYDQANAALVLGKWFMRPCVASIVAAGLFSGVFRVRPVAWILGLYIVAYLGLLAFVKYGPPRYFVPLLIPLSILTAIAWHDLTQVVRRRLPGSPAMVLPSLIVAVLIAGETVRIASYVRHPQYSYTTMVSELTGILRAREGDLKNVVLFGNLTDQLSLASGVRSVNSDLGTPPLHDRLVRHRPAYVVVQYDTDPVVSAIRDAGGEVNALGAWDVFGNYYGHGEPVTLLHVTWRD